MPYDSLTQLDHKKHSKMFFPKLCFLGCTVVCSDQPVAFILSLFFWQFVCFLLHVLSVIFSNAE
jgi:hypothetical protein